MSVRAHFLGCCFALVMSMPPARTMTQTYIPNKRKSDIEPWISPAPPGPIYFPVSSVTESVIFVIVAQHYRHGVTDLVLTGGALLGGVRRVARKGR
jgi:hypothetical protein